MPDGKRHVFDVGTIIEIDMDEDLSTVTGQEFHVQKPDGTEVIWPATISPESVAPFALELLTYEIQSGDLDMPGRWIVQPYLQFIGSLLWQGHGDSVSFEVYPDYSLD
jgi:hypothetical protein